MAKEYGSDRLVEQLMQPYADVKKRVDEMKASGKYSKVEITPSGGFLAIEKGKAKHKPDEITAAEYMAKAGYQVILKDETGQLTTREGYIYSFT